MPSVSSPLVAAKKSLADMRYADSLPSVQVKLESSDEQSFEVTEEVAFESETVKNMIEGAPLLVVLALFRSLVKFSKGSACISVEESSDL